jgi:predicted DNA-binding ribbon-helix-helix protein
MKSTVIKRSIIVDVHKTSICLEDAFWSSLKEIAQAQGATVAQTVTEIDKNAATCPPRSVYLYSTGSAHKKWGPP